MNKSIVICFAIGGICVLSLYLLLKNSHPLIAQQKQSQYAQSLFQLSFDEGFAHSNLYPPDKLTTAATTNATATITWEFADRELTTAPGIAPEYGLLSGFRIYRDGYWFADIPKTQKTFTDTGLSPNETYTYAVSGLTFDNKIEGTKSATLTVQTKPGTRKSVTFSKKKITAYLAEGDSITEGKQVSEQARWVSLVGAYLRQKSPGMIVTNKGVNASLSSGVLDRLPEELRLYHPDLVTIAIGTNDMTGASRDIGNLSMDQYRKNLQKIISLVRSDPKRELVLVNIYYFGCCDEKRMMWNKLLRDIANEQGILLVDVETAMERQGKDALVAGLHPTSAGHAIIAHAIISALQR